MILFLAISIAPAAAETPCPATATLSVFAENLVPDTPTVELNVDGQLLSSAGSCAGPGATTYEETLTCTGSGILHCDKSIPGLKPGLWVHRLTFFSGLPGSDEQRQARRLLLVAGDPLEVSNTLVWTVYPASFVVRSKERASPDGLSTVLAKASTYTRNNIQHRALVTFSPDTFVRSAPSPIYLRGPCEPNDTGGDEPGLSLSGDRIVVDAVDPIDGERGGVVLSVDTCHRKVLRLTGNDNVWRGLNFEGSRRESPLTQLDTIVITGSRNKIEHSFIRGPTRGDAVAVEPDPATGDLAQGNAIFDTEIGYAADKGIKVVDGSTVHVERTCLHHNQNGGVQLTTSSTSAIVGGSATVIESVVQRNIGASAQQGLFAGVQDKPIETHLSARGNVVRFNGAGGIFVANDATVTLSDNVLADNYRAGPRLDHAASEPGAQGRGAR